jgi:hypothetical protein
MNNDAFNERFPPEKIREAIAAMRLIALRPEVADEVADVLGKCIRPNRAKEQAQ